MFVRVYVFERLKEKTDTQVTRTVFFLGYDCYKYCTVCFLFANIIWITETEQLVTVLIFLITMSPLWVCADYQNNSNIERKKYGFFKC
ncbi:hypothetical protein BY458DRAFT_518351 [Sporodiniella umbellata]|nr:hypothetical protein BY458DRAFT_518351 [Sporodiniella umbellata]